MTCMLPLTLAAALAAFPSCASPSAPPAVEQDPAPAAAPRAAEFDQTHALWTEVLRGCVKDDRVDYAKLKADPQKLDQYVQRLASVTPEELSRWKKEQRFAYWINAYNACAIKKVVAHYPL